MLLKAFIFKTTHLKTRILKKTSNCLTQSFYYEKRFNYKFRKKNHI